MPAEAPDVCRARYKRSCSRSRGAEAPSRRITEPIRGHFRRAHDEKRLAEKAIYHARNQVENPAAIFMPMLASRGAGILCKFSAPEGQPVFVTDPPHGDARRLRYLLQSRNLWSEVATLPPRKQAEYLESIDRDLPQQRRQAEAREELRRFRRGEPASRRDAFARALQLLLLASVDAGEQITPLIGRLERYSKQRPAQLARLLAAQLGASTAAFASVPPRELTKLVARELGFANGRLPQLTKRRLWEL